MGDECECVWDGDILEGWCDRCIRVSSAEFRAQLRKSREDNARLRAEVERARKAIEPFRDESGNWVEWVEWTLKEFGLNLATVARLRGALERCCDWMSVDRPSMWNQVATQGYWDDHKEVMALARAALSPTTQEAGKRPRAEAAKELGALMDAMRADLAAREEAKREECSHSKRWIENLAWYECERCDVRWSFDGTRITRATPPEEARKQGDKCGAQLPNAYGEDIRCVATSGHTGLHTPPANPKPAKP